MNKFSKTKDSIFTPAFQLNPKKWVDYYINLLNSVNEEQLKWNQLLEFSHDAFRSIKSVIQHDLYIWSNPISRLDQSSNYLSLLKESQADSKIADLNYRINNTYKRYMGDFRVIKKPLQDNTDKTKNFLLKKQLDEQVDQLNKKYDQQKVALFSELKRLIKDFEYLLQQIPDDAWNINYPEFKERFEFKDAHHDFFAKSFSRLKVWSNKSWKN